MAQTKIVSDRLSDTLEFDFAELALGNGTAALPALSFTSDQDTGLYSIADNRLGFSAGGSIRFEVRDTHIQSEMIHRFSAGSASVPSLTFISDPNTGIYNSSGADLLEFTTGGARRFYCTTSYISLDTGMHIENADGTAGTPAYTFFNDPDTGFYGLGGNRIGVSIGGVQHWAFTAAGDLGATTTGRILIGDGTAGSPGIQFTNDANTGIYRPATDNLSIATAGVQRMTIGGTGDIVFGSGVELYNQDGTVALPSYTFDADPNTGLFKDAADRLQVSCGGTEVFRFGTTQISTNNNIVALNGFWSKDGTAGAPAFTFDNDQDTGIYRIGAERVGFAANGTLAFDYTNTRLEVFNVPLWLGNGSSAAPSLTFSLDSDTGMYRTQANTIGFATGGTLATTMGATGVSDDVAYIPFSFFGGVGFGGSGQSGDAFFKRTTASVSTTPVIIGPTAYGLIIVNGVTGGGASVFTDLLVDNYGAAPTVFASKAGGGPAARTYALSGDQVTLAMASGTYSISFSAWSAAIR